MAASSIDKYHEAHHALGEALSSRVGRLCIVAPLRSWDSTEMNVLVFSPLYQEFDVVRKSWDKTVPSLPLHLPVELDAGVGPYATGRHLVLLLNKVAPAGKWITRSAQMSLEFITTWEHRLDAMIPWLANRADSHTRNWLQNISDDKVRRIRAIIESILAHEIGHTTGLLPIFPKLPAFIRSVLLSIPEARRPALRHIFNALGDLTADVANLQKVTDDVLLMTTAYHFYNLYHCLELEPTVSEGRWEILTRDPDCLGAILVYSAIIKAENAGASVIASSSIRQAFRDLNLDIERILYDLKCGHTESAFELLELSRYTDLKWLLKGRHPASESCFENRMSIQKIVGTALVEFLEGFSR